MLQEGHFANYIIQDPPPPSLDQRPIARGLQASPRYRWTRYRTLFAPHPPSAPSLHLDTTSAPHGPTRPQTTTRTADTKDHPNAKSTARAYVRCCPSRSLRARHQLYLSPIPPASQKHTQHALLSRGAGSSSTRQHARGPFFSTLLHIIALVMSAYSGVVFASLL